MPTNVLVPLDGSPLSERALPYAATVARVAGGRLVLVRAVLPGAFASPERRTRAELAAVGEKLSAGGLQVEGYVSDDEPGEAIVRAAQRFQADLIVMSTHGRSGLGRWVYGSVAEQVLQQADVPVLLISAACAPDWSPAPGGGARRILVPLDGSALAEGALGAAGELAGLLDAELHMLRIVIPSVSGPAALPSPARGGDDRRSDLEETRQYLDGVAERVRAGGRRVGSQIEFAAGAGSVASAITARGRDPGTAAVAMATHGRGGVARMITGSVATGVLHGVNVPLLLVRPAALRQAVSPAAAVEGAPTERGSRSCTMTLTAQDLELVRLGLQDLLNEPEREQLPAAAVRALLDRVEAASGASTVPGPST